MKVAVLSDIHSNLEAYRASILDVARRGDVDELWCLGDVVGYGADPELCVGLTAALRGDAAAPTVDDELDEAVAAMAGRLRHVVRGNHDAAVAGGGILRHFNAAARDAARWTADTLSTERLAFVESLPLTAGDADLLVHASPFEPERFHYVMTVSDAGAAFAATEARVVFIGHTHQPVVVAWWEGEPAPAPWGKLEPHERYIVNVGSVGQPRDGDPRAAYVVYDRSADTVELVRVPYDVETAAAKIRRAGLPAALASRLFGGW